MEQNDKVFTAFVAYRRIASGTLSSVARSVKELIGADSNQPVFIFDDLSGELIEVDFRGTTDEVLARLEGDSAGGGPAAASLDQSAPRGPGRPKLGVVAREVTLLPRHWDWLSSQPGGASVALRKLVEDARRGSGGQDRVRRSQEAAYRFMSAMAGDLPGYEEATRALFAGLSGRFDEHTASWPADLREYTKRIAEGAFRPSGLE